MTVPKTLPHLDAVRLALKDGPAVHTGRAPQDAEPPYISLHVDPGSPTASSLSAAKDQAAIVVQATCVGLTADQAIWVSDFVHTRLLAGRLEVADRSGWMPTLDTAGPPVQRDDDVNPPLYYVTPQYRLRSSAA